MVPGRDRTRDPWINSQTRICSQTRYPIAGDLGRKATKQTKTMNPNQTAPNGAV